MHKAFSQKRGPQPQRNPLAAENEKLRRQNQRLQEDLEKAHIIIDVQKSGQAVGASDDASGEMVMAAVDQLSPLVGVKPARQALAVPRASWYRRRNRRLFPRPAAGLRFSPRALTEAEQQAVLTCHHEDRFQDCSPVQVYAALLDEGQFHCSIRTMYRLLEARGESRERPDQRTHPPYQKPELLANVHPDGEVWIVRQTLVAPRCQSMSLHLSARYSLGLIPVVRATASSTKHSGCLADVRNRLYPRGHPKMSTEACVLQRSGPPSPTASTDQLQHMDLRQEFSSSQPGGPRIAERHSYTRLFAAIAHG
ncbi:MAG: hypothetical protein ABSG13_31460 [Bryobacteraceae bacterium]